MARLVMFCVASSLFVARLNADELPAFIRRTPEEILGTINPRVVEECVVKRFFDPYPSLNASQNRLEYRWRVRVPDGSKVNVLWAHGVLPDDDLPKPCIQISGPIPFLKIFALISRSAMSSGIYPSPFQ